MLIDEVSIKVKAGDGGKGAVSFRRNGQTAKGGPDGGNGGNGGNVYFQGVNDITALRQFQYKKVLVAENGVDGGRNNLYGKNADHLIIKVPIGTLVTNTQTSESFEVANDTDTILVAVGGIGGKGNNSFKTATNQAPRFAEKGEPGEEKDLSLVLKLTADIGLIGFPNAGKSSILKAISNADPKIGDYFFTTTEPNLGVLEDIVVADIPGLIEHASEGKGLGIKFLKHIEKTKFLVHCISLENNDLADSYETVRREIENFKPGLSDKTKLIVLTKKDLLSQEEIDSKVASLDSIGIEAIPFSVLDDNDIQYLKEKLLTLFKNGK